MTLTQEQATWFAETFQRLSDNVGQVVLGKPGSDVDKYRPAGRSF